MNGRTWFPVSSGLLTPKHYQAIGSALWVFLWLIHHQYRPKNGETDTGVVNAGGPVTCAQIGLELGIPAETCRKHVAILERGEYVRSESVAGLGKRYFIVNPIRWALSATKNGDTAQRGMTEHGEGVSPNLTGRVTKFGEANKEQRTQVTTKNKTKAIVFNPAEMELPEWLPRDAWTEFVEHRKELKKTLTEQAAKANIRKLSEFWSKGQDPRTVIDQTIASGWTGLFEAKTGKKVPKAQAPGVDAPDSYELTMREHLRAKAAGVRIQ
jgi:hypothetical protein